MKYRTIHRGVVGILTGGVAFTLAALWATSHEPLETVIACAVTVGGANAVRKGWHAAQDLTTRKDILPEAMVGFIMGAGVGVGLGIFACMVAPALPMPYP